METVYHGTSLNRAYQIIQAQLILRTNQGIQRYSTTRYGYVYVTKRLCDAMDFSSRPEVGTVANIIFVFRIEIDDRELLDDPDEAKWNSTLSAGGCQECFRIERDLELVSDIKAVYVKRLYSNEELGEYLQKMNVGTEEIDESEWGLFHEGESCSQRRSKISNRL